MLYLSMCFYHSSTINVWDYDYFNCSSSCSPILSCLESWSSGDFVLCLAILVDRSVSFWNTLNISKSVSWFVPFDSSGKWIMTRSLDTVLSPRNCTARQTAWQMPRRMIAEGLWKFHVWCILLSFWMVLLNENHWIYMKWSPLWWECQDLYTSVVSRFLGARFDIPISMRIRQRARRVHAQGWTRRFISVASNCIASGSCDLWILQGTCDTDCHSILGQSWKTMTCQSYRAIQLLQSIFEWFPIPNHCCQADRFANDLHTNLTALTQKADACDDRIEWNYIEYGLTTLFGTLRLHGCRMVYSWLPSNIGG